MLSVGQREGRLACLNWLQQSLAQPRLTVDNLDWLCAEH